MAQATGARQFEMMNRHHTTKGFVDDSRHDHVSPRQRSETADRRRAHQHSTSSTAAKRAGGFVWIGLEDPDQTELWTFAEQLGLHPLAVIDAVTGKQQPKVQSYDEHLSVVVWVLHRHRSQRLDVGGLFLFVRDALLLTVQRDMGTHPLDLAAILDATETTLEGGAGGGLYDVMANAAGTYAEVASEIEVALERLETDVFDEARTEDRAAVCRVGQQVGDVNRAVSSLARALEMSRDHVSHLVVGSEKIEPYLRDLLDDLAGTAQLVSDQSVALDGVVARHQSNISNQQNDDTRKISAFAALLSVPPSSPGYTE